ncbi:MAG: DUF4826 family protein [Pseudomonadales bacterium]|jgi:hypothetical protein|nr:hypothetical protein [Gammaproteobacteria bacterium]MDP6027244.1 DUF4826 family protein [Pseudomonadales bacterium]MDP6316461.1 DUF4826 family protein [Pseudomonadales bacterium]MDP7316468.1 DUF4826 family protein [Pseudomonadales bacterium]MDP7575809.1 DUF4826 family protein [Pseudomonadales bacterium]|tara:strand:+ start:170 stop:610 length:441 start_codon:yes stop_codon:yes gene_type:complete
MTENNANLPDFKTWYRTLLNAVVQEMVRVEAISGENIEAKPSWAIPLRILIGQIRVQGAQEFIWVISGPDVSTDHIDGNLAASPRDAARHFAMKWQMDAERLNTLVKQKAEVVNPEVDREAFANTLIGYAESLYDIVNNDDFWDQT